MNSTQIRRYLDRIGHSAPVPPPTVESLHDLHLRHVCTVPFENLSLYLGEAIGLDLDALQDKIVVRRRGGCCFELSVLFTDLLRSLGFAVDLVGATVLGDRPGPANIHAAAVVHLDHPWLADVGYGRFTHLPLRLDTPEEQVNAGGMFTVRGTSDGDLEVGDGAGPVYRVERRPRTAVDFGPPAWWIATHPRSPLGRGPLCTRATARGATTLINGRLHTVEDGRHTSIAAGDGPALLRVYEGDFGLLLPRVPDPVRTTATVKEK